MAPDPPNPRGRWSLFRNWLSLGGAVIATGSLFAFLLLFAMDLIAGRSNPYEGILAYLVAPIFLALGLVLMGVGVLRHRRRLRHMTPGTMPQKLMIDLSRPRDQKAAALFIVGSIIFLLLTAIGSQRTYHYTESVQFCGQACHTPMKPEFTAYLNSPHARIECSACHVGPGATWYVKSKINGVRQLYCALTDDFQRPIKTPIHNLRPAQETCEQCHWPQRYVGNLDRTYSHFLADETNTPFSVRLSLHVGGGDPNHGPVGGIHWHMNLANKVEYIATDEQRQIIPWVRFTDARGVVTEYRTADFKENAQKAAIRTMDCMDCHNRPAHHFRSPNDAVDLALATGRIDPAVPWIKSNVVAALIAPYATESEALQKIANSLQSRYAQTPKIGTAIAAAQQIYKQNLFPEMKADWRIYPNHIGHKDWPGCFRCHDGRHKSPDGKRMIKASDCNSCHTILAQGVGPQLEQLSAKGHNFFHIDAEYSDFSCTGCHTGAFTK
jgi:nitrate/TMAO reductase-like tetraheme cytochrome c subunit